MAKWPRKRKRPLPDIVIEQNEKFRQANKLVKYIDAQLQVTARNATKGTPLYPRDVQVALMYGTLFSLKFDDGRTLHSVATRNAVSESLDVLGIKRGSILVRLENGWLILEPGPAGEVLTSQGPDQDVHFASPLGPSGILWDLIAELDAPVNGDFDFPSLDLSAYATVQFHILSVVPKNNKLHIDTVFYNSSGIIETGYDWVNWLVKDNFTDLQWSRLNRPSIKMTLDRADWEVGPDPGAGISAIITLADPTSSKHKMMFFEGAVQHIDGTISHIRGTGIVTTNDPLTGFKLFSPNREMDSGRIKILGLK